MSDSAADCDGQYRGSRLFLEHPKTGFGNYTVVTSTLALAQALIANRSARVVYVSVAAGLGRSDGTSNWQSTDNGQTI